MSQLLKVIDTIVTHIFFGQLEFLLIGTGSYIFVCEGTEIKESITIANYVVGAIHMIFDDLFTNTLQRKRSVNKNPMS